MRKKLKFLTIVLLFLPLLLSTVKAEVLIQIEDGDSWTYWIKDSTDVFVEFEVVDYDYFGNEEDLIRVNNIETNESLELVKLESLFSVPFYVNLTNNYEWGIGSAKMSYSFDEIISDDVWRTARGNLPYERTLVINTTLSFTDIYFNHTNQPDYEHNAVLTYYESMTNPNIIEPLSTGTVKLNDRTLSITGVLENVNFLGLDLGIVDVNMIVDIVIEERYEASDLFNFWDTECRNLTIRPLSTILTETSFSEDETFYFGFSDNEEVPIDSLGPIQDWIFSFEAGLPLLVTEKAQSIGSTNSKAILEDETDILRIMELFDLNVVNSDFTFPAETLDTNLIFFSVLSGLLVTLSISRKINKNEEKKGN